MSSPVPFTPALGWTLFAAPEDASGERLQEGRQAVLDQRFRILAPIGRGGMGSVYLCEDIALRSRAAVKVLRSENRDMRRRFVDEATLLANLRHPHLVQVFAVGETGEGHPYMAMEYLGQSLDSRLREGEPLPWREVVELSIQIAEALGILHRAGVVHRDVKPANIAELRGATGRVFVKLLDLGVARVDDLASVQQGGDVLPPRRRTKAGKVLGTPGYVPPEAGLSVPDPSFDVYGLGATIFRLCTGVMPDPLEPRSMRAARPELDLPEELESIVARALAVLPEDRIRSAEELSRELAGIHTVHGEEVEETLFDGCYELISLLGIGAKAEVYWAYHRDARRYVALKILREEVTDDEEERVRFDREARALGVLRHPSIPGLVECRTGAERRRPFIAMELCPGQRAVDLGPEPLSVDEVIAVGRQLASALEAMHRVGIVHRDLNRTNVLIDRGDGDRGLRASIIDLGQVELLDTFYAGVDERYPTPPEARTRLGSGGLERVDWTAPEAKAGEGWTTQSDVYSLGLLLHLLLTGKRPAEDPDGGWVSPVERVPECQGSLAEAILGALQVDPKYRLDAKGLGDYLRDAAEDRVAILAEEELLRGAELRPLGVRSDRIVDLQGPTSGIGEVDRALGDGDGLRVSASTSLEGLSDRLSGLVKRPSWIVLTMACASLVAAGVLLTLLVTEGSRDRGSAIAAATRAARAGERGPEESARPTSAMLPLDGTREPGSEIVVRRDLDETSTKAGEGSVGATVGVEEALPTDTARSTEGIDLSSPSPETTPVASKAVASSGRSLSGALFKRQLQRHRAELRECARGAAALEVTVAVSAGGAVTDVGAEPASPLVKLCLRDVLTSIAFPSADRPSTHRLKLGGGDPRN